MISRTLTNASVSVRIQQPRPHRLETLESTKIPPFGTEWLTNNRKLSALIFRSVRTIQTLILLEHLTWQLTLKRFNSLLLLKKMFSILMIQTKTAVLVKSSLELSKLSQRFLSDLTLRLSKPHQKGTHLSMQIGHHGIMMPYQIIKSKTQPLIRQRQSRAKEVRVW